MRRPIGITLLAIFYILGGIGGGIVTFSAYTHLDALLSAAQTNLARTIIIPGGQASTFVYSLLVLLAFISALIFIVGAGLWSMEPWAWTLAIAFTSGGLVVNGVTVVVGSVSFAALAGNSILSLVTLIYLLSPGVRQAFAG